MARKIENEEFSEETAVAADSSPTDSEKRKTVVVNVPKRKKLLRTPSHIIRIALIWCFAIILYLLTYPFLEVRFYIKEDLGVTPRIEEAYSVLAAQAEIDAAEVALRQAIDGLVEAPKEEESGEESAASAQESSLTSDTSSDEESQSSQAAESGGFLEMSTLNYNWTYTVREGVQEEKLTQLIEEVKKIKRSDYTEASVEKLNAALLNAQKVLCASVFVSQSALQMMFGGSVGEAFGASIDLSNTFMRSIFTFALSILPIIAIFACIFDKKRMIKNVIVLICSILALADIFFTIYPYIGIGAVLTIMLYIVIILLNIGGFYAGQQEKYIVSHPEKEAEFTEKHPHFVKALINEKSIGGSSLLSRSERERTSAKEAKKRRNKKKKS